jgi:hypothetical protein
MMPIPHYSRKFDPSARPIMVDKNQLYKFDRTRGDGQMQLEDLVGKDEVDAIMASGSMEFVVTGDTGNGINSEQEQVVDAMARDMDVKNPANGPTFFLSLGDIIYGPDKAAHYANKFYRPNKSWLQPAPGFKGIILGIPGNHDGEVRDERDKPSLAAFVENFCQPDGKHPPMAESFGATMANQPGAYWWLVAPFLDLIGLYSNAAEDFGILGVDPTDTHQQDWLTQSLKTIAKGRRAGRRRALVIATHHPPYNQGFSETESGHPGSPEMLAQIDKACNDAGVWPDMFLSGHSHNYQYYRRTVSLTGGQTKIIPYLIAGTGGIGSQPVPRNVGAMDKTGTVKYASGRGSQGRDNTVYGYLRVRAGSKVVQATFVQALADHRDVVEAVAIDLATGQETSPDFS